MSSTPSTAGAAGAAAPAPTTDRTTAHVPPQAVSGISVVGPISRADHLARAAKAKADLTAIATGELGLVADPSDHWDASFVAPRERIRGLLTTLRDDGRLAFNVLLDITAIDYLAYPGWRGERFAVVYLLKSTRHLGNRIRIKVLVEEDDPVIESVHDLWRNADWAEREVFDQYGITFRGHPNLKRLLNHHEFVGHPLRKDYPAQKRQHLSINDPMLDQLTLRMTQVGWQVIDAGVPAPIVPQQQGGGRP